MLATPHIHAVASLHIRANASRRARPMPARPWVPSPLLKVRARIETRLDHSTRTVASGPAAAWISATNVEGSYSEAGSVTIAWIVRVYRAKYPALALQSVMLVDAMGPSVFGGHLSHLITPVALL
jgi:hypothetical protein